MFSSKLIQFVALSLSSLLGACMAPLDEDLESLPDERAEADPVAKDFYGNVMTGQIWSSPAGTNALGGIGREVAMGELELEDSTAQQAVLTLGMQQTDPTGTFGAGRILARLKYGIGSASQTIVIDWALKNAIELPAGKVTITAIQTDAQGWPAIPLPGGLAPRPADGIFTPVILTSSLAAGDRGSVYAPTLTLSYGLPPAGTIGFQCPAGSKGILVTDPRGQALSDIQVDIFASRGVNRLFLVNPADSAIRTTGVILGDASVVELLSPGGIDHVGIVWLLEG